MNITFAIMFPLTMLLNNRVLTTIPGTFSPFYWAMLSFMTIINLVAQYPFNYCMSRRSALVWPPITSLDQKEGGSPVTKNPWPVLVVISLLLLVGSLFVTINQLA
jgi:uncharacterized membrane protein YdfJ with MMPL/SSD domain